MINTSVRPTSWNQHSVNPPLNSGSVSSASSLNPQTSPSSGVLPPQARTSSMLLNLNANLSAAKQVNLRHLDTVSVAEIARKDFLQLGREFIENHINKDAKFPELDRNILQAQSSEYIFSPTSDIGPLTPFVRTEIINIPDAIFEQYNQTQCYTRMGLMADIQRAWITVDNRLYLWNYMNGFGFQSFEELPHTILSVNLIKPKPGTFIESVNHVLLLTTPLNLYIIAVSYDEVTKNIQLFNTGMVVSIKGLDVTKIVASKKTGRIFFVGNNDGTNVWELTYSNVESWFKAKCSKICHTRSGLISALTPSVGIMDGSLDGVSGTPGLSSGGGGVINKLNSVIGSIIPGAIETEYITYVTIDDTRNLLYTLSSKSTIRTYHITGKDELQLVITYTLPQILSNLHMITATSSSSNPAFGSTISSPVGHHHSAAHNSASYRINNGRSHLGGSSATTLLSKGMSIVSLQAIERTESAQIFLVAITSTGCRLYIRAARTFGFGFGGIGSMGPSSMGHNMGTSSTSSHANAENILPPNTMQVTQVRFPPSTDVNVPVSQSKTLLSTKETSRVIQPGHFFAVVPDAENPNMGDKVFVSSLDTGRIIHQYFSSSSNASSSYIENACFLEIEGFVQAIELITPPFAASDKPQGFANEPASQYTIPPTQVAILTNTGVHIYTRRHLYQTFELLGSDIMTFFDIYGRTETCSSALSVACRDSNGVASERREVARKAYIEAGGKAHLQLDDDSSFNMGLGSINMNLGVNMASLTSSSIVKPVSSSLSSQSGMLGSGSATSATADKMDLVRLSGRFDGLATYISRIVRPIWYQHVFKAKTFSSATSRGTKSVISDMWSSTGSAASGASKASNTTLKKFSLNLKKSDLETVQIALFEIAEFLEKNKPFIDGLSGGPNDRVLGLGSRSEDIALQAEHRSFTALVKLNKIIRESIAFILLLNNETLGSPHGIEGILAYLPEESRAKIATLSFCDLVSSAQGTELAKELVTCVVNRSIAEGGSVEAIATLLQERCESFCSGQDVIIYRGFEALRKARDYSNDLHLKNENLIASAELFERAAGTMGVEMLEAAIKEFKTLDCYSGAIQVALAVATSIDRSKDALSFLTEGKPEGDFRKSIFDSRVNIYRYVFEMLSEVERRAQEAVNKVGKVNPNAVMFSNGQANVTAEEKLRDSTYEIAFSSDDQVFHFCLYDWFMEQKLDNRLLEIDTPYILSYLKTNSKHNVDVAVLLWVYYQKRSNFYAASDVLYGLALSEFDLSLGVRIEFLARARGYCNCPCTPDLRQSLIELGNSIRELLDVASIQDEILSAVSNDTRFVDNEKKISIESKLNGKILNISELFNEYADPLGYYEVCFSIFQVSDFRGSDEIMKCWQKLIQTTHQKAVDVSSSSSNNVAEPFEFVSNVVQSLGQQFLLSEFVFPPDQLIPQLEIYNLENAPRSPVGWVIETFINTGLSYECIYIILSDMLERREYPFDDAVAIKKLSLDLVYLIEKWIDEARNQDVGHIVSREQLSKLKSTVGSVAVADIERKLNY